MRGRGGQPANWGKLAFLLLVLFLAVKVRLWLPYFELISIVGLSSGVKAAYTVACTNPSAIGNLQRVGGRVLLVDDPADPYYRYLLAKYPPPRLARDLPFHAKVEGLRGFVNRLLPERSPLPQTPEPVRATELLGDNPLGARYPKLCSKDAMIFVQYLTAFGIVSHPVGLHHHVGVEVWNPEERKWEYHDPFFDCSASYRGRGISAAEAHDLLEGGTRIDFPVSRQSVFATVVQIPRSDFSRGHRPRACYFDFNNLAYYKVVKTSRASDALWKGRSWE